MHCASSDEATALRAEFTALYKGCSEWLFSYLLSLLRRPDDAEEVLQQTAEVLWQKFDQYHLGTEFRAWACRIAHFKPTAFSEMFFKAVDEEAMAGDGALLGKYSVTVVKQEISGATADKHGLAGGVAPGGIKRRWIIPARYGSQQQSGLTAEVKAGTNKLDFALKSDPLAA